MSPLRIAKIVPPVDLAGGVTLGTHLPRGAILISPPLTNLIAVARGFAGITGGLNPLNRRDSIAGTDSRGALCGRPITVTDMTGASYGIRAT